MPKLQILFLAGSGALGLVALAVGIWLFRLSGAANLIASGGGILLITLVTALWWKGRDERA